MIHTRRGKQMLRKYGTDKANILHVHVADIFPIF